MYKDFSVHILSLRISKEFMEALRSCTLKLHFKRTDLLKTYMYLAYNCEKVNYDTSSVQHTNSKNATDETLVYKIHVLFIRNHFISKLVLNSLKFKKI